MTASGHELFGPSQTSISTPSHVTRPACGCAPAIIIEPRYVLMYMLMAIIEAGMFLGARRASSNPTILVIAPNATLIFDGELLGIK